MSGDGCSRVFCYRNAPVYHLGRGVYPGERTLREAETRYDRYLQGES